MVLFVMQVYLVKLELKECQVLLVYPVYLDYQELLLDHLLVFRLLLQFLL